MKDEAELLATIRAGDVDRFGELVRRHQDMVFAILGRYDRDSHRVEDQAQEAFLRAWRALDRFDGRVPFAHWLARITTRIALDHLRQKRRQKETPWEDLDLGADALEGLRASESGDDLAPEYAREVLDLAMRELTAEQQLVLTLLEIEDRSVKETAQLTGWTGVGVRVRAHRARKKLAQAVARLRGKSL